jgi:hypothetical protein
LTKEYERPLTESEKGILKRHIDEAKAVFPKKIKLIILQTLAIISFAIIIYYFPKIWLIIILAIISFFIIWSIYLDITHLLKLPEFLEEKKKVINTGVVRVNEINIDRYIKIDNFEDEGNHFIVEYNGMLSLIGGQEFLGVRKLKNRIEQIEILNSEKNRIYYDKVNKTGKDISPYYVFKKGISDKLVESEIWEKLTNRNPFSGKLEDLNEFIAEDKQK